MIDNNLKQVNPCLLFVCPTRKEAHEMYKRQSQEQKRLEILSSVHDMSKQTARKMEKKFDRSRDLRKVSPKPSLEEIYRKGKWV